jgi:aerobic-type carbon monoxide dehydrogenase small subunit (CoxS/CutS family)
MSAFGDPPPNLDRPGFGTPHASSSPPASDGTVRVVVRVNGTYYSAEAEPRTLLSDFLRHELGLTGTKVGCEHGACGACTVQLDGEPVRACLTLAVQVQDADITTIEGLPHGRLQESFHEHHALQCGFCTAGMLMTLDAFLKTNPEPTEDEVKHALSGNLCRCTGYRPIIEAVLDR